MTSRFITYPSALGSDDISDNHKIVCVDVSKDDYNEIAVFLTGTAQDFDVYFYEGAFDDLQWLSYVCQDAEKILINPTSEVTILNAPTLVTDRPIEYFEQIEQEFA